MSLRLYLIIMQYISFRYPAISEAAMLQLRKSIQCVSGFPLVLVH